MLRDGYWTMADATEAKRHRGVGAEAASLRARSKATSSVASA